jgi:soluble lytic murein transglycosylase-like protein
MRTMIMSLTRWSWPSDRWARVAFVGALAALVPIAYLHGARDGRSGQAALQQGESEIERKIMALVVERYPQATIRDFAGFPAVVLEVAREAAIDFRLLLAIVDKESGFRPDAVGKSGEIGLMQLLPSTAELVIKRLGLEYTPPVSDKSGGYASLGSLAEPAFNLRVGTAYLRWQIERYGFNATALRAYNRHPDRAMEHRPGDRYAEDIGLRYVALSHALRD